MLWIFSNLIYLRGYEKKPFKHTIILTFFFNLVMIEISRCFYIKNLFLNKIIWKLRILREKLKRPCLQKKDWIEFWHFYFQTKIIFTIFFIVIYIVTSRFILFRLDVTLLSCFNLMFEVGVSLFQSYGNWPCTSLAHRVANRIGFCFKRYGCRSFRNPMKIDRDL